MVKDTFEYIVKKYNIEVGRQYIVNIPNMGRNDMAELFAELGFNLGAEVGVERGIYSEILCKANPKLHLHSVDSWKLSSYEPVEYLSSLGVDVLQMHFDGTYKEAKERLADYNCTIVRKSSMSALEDFENNSLDFVYIDGQHNFVNFTNDLYHWEKKVRVGGIVSGHDYATFPFRKFNHVKRVLDAYIRCYKMIPLFIAGDFEVRKGEIRDKYRSWFWVKT